MLTVLQKKMSTEKGQKIAQLEWTSHLNNVMETKKRLPGETMNYRHEQKKKLLS
jgi:hypothetical protein